MGNAPDSREARRCGKVQKQTSLRCLCGLKVQKKHLDLCCGASVSSGPQRRQWREFRLREKQFPPWTETQERLMKRKGGV